MASSITPTGADFKFAAYDAPTRGVTKGSSNLQESNPLFNKTATDQQEDDSRIKLKNVKQKWGDAVEEEKKEEKKKEEPPAPTEESFKKVSGSFGATQPQAKKKEEKKVNEKLEANKGLF